jgi:hypothetical protein
MGFNYFLLLTTELHGVIREFHGLIIYNPNISFIRGSYSLTLCKTPGLLDPIY